MVPPGELICTMTAAAREFSSRSSASTRSWSLRIRPSILTRAIEPDAVNALRLQKNVDVILMDIMMPEMDGIDTIREIRKIPAYKHVPIIAVTAKAMKGDREKCMEAGAWDYLSKPVDAELMVGVLRAWLG